MQSDPTSVTDRLSRLAPASANDAAGSTSQKLATLRVGDLPSPDDDRTFPNRYEIRERDDGQVLLCGEAPGVTVYLDRSFAFTEAEARKLGERVILIDGAGQFAPMMDESSQLYNLDHHQDCLRAFTLASCEQALVLVLKGLRLDKGDWTLYANEPDLDTVFALWVLLNYRRVRNLSPAQRDAILPLLHLEGAIDANGFEVAEYCGLPQSLLQHEKARLDALHQQELEAKRSGRWETELAQYTRDMLLAIDQMVYKPSDFDDYASVDSIFCHVEIPGDHVAVVCGDGAGIYEVEKRLKGMWGDRLGLIALQKEPGHFTLRRSASLSGIALADAYDKFNLLDPAVDGKPPEKRWGGSDDIGGSPRPGGSQLTPREVGNVLKLTYQQARPLQYLQRLSSAVLWGVGLCLGAAVGVFGWRVATAPSPSPESYAMELLLAAGLLGITTWFLTRKLSSGWTWLFGWRRAAGNDWLGLIPLVIVGGMLGGVWTPPMVAEAGRPLWLAVAAVVLSATSLELCFHGLLHGLLILDFRVQGVKSRWFLSRPVLATGLIYSLVTVLVLWFWPVQPWKQGRDMLEFAATVGGGALLASLASGMIRERSLSVWPSVAALVLAGLARLAYLFF